MAVVAWVYRRHFAATARRIEGSVVGHAFRVVRTKRGYGGRHYPVVAYHVDGVRHEVTSGVGQTTPRLRKGAAVGVLVPPTGPSRAVIDTTLDLHYWAILFGVLAAIALPCGAFVAYAEHQQAEARSSAHRPQS